MRGIKIPQYEFALKMQGGAYARGGAYLRDTTVYTPQIPLARECLRTHTPCLYRQQCYQF